MQEFYTFYFAKYKHKFLIQMFSNRYVYNSLHTNLDRVVTNLDRVVTKKKKWKCSPSYRVFLCFTTL